MGFDFMENVGASIVMYRYPKKTLFIDSMTPIMTLFKMGDCRRLINGRYLFDGSCTKKKTKAKNE